MSQLDFFDYITGITIGSIAAELATELEEPLKPLVAMAVYGVATLVLTWVTTKFPKSRKFINGTPTIVIHNGRLTVLPASTKRPVNPEDLPLPPPPASIQTEVIMDGQIMGENLQRLGLDEKWLQKQLSNQGLKSPGEVFLAVCDDRHQLTVF